MRWQLNQVALPIEGEGGVAGNWWICKDLILSNRWGTNRITSSNVRFLCIRRYVRTVLLLHIKNFSSTCFLFTTYELRTGAGALTIYWALVLDYEQNHRLSPLDRKSFGGLHSFHSALQSGPRVQTARRSSAASNSNY